MKRSLLLLSLLFCMNAFAQPSPGDLTARLSNGILSLNGNNLSPEWRSGAVLRFLGTADRKSEGYNITHTYDKYGIVLFVRPSTTSSSGAGGGPGGGGRTNNNSDAGLKNESTSPIAPKPSSSSVADGELAEIQFYFSAPNENNNVVAKGYYSGSFKIEDLTLSSNLTKSTVFNKLSSYTRSESYSANSYRLAKNGVYIYFQFNSDDTRLIKVSIGKDTKW